MTRKQRFPNERDAILVDLAMMQDGEVLNTTCPACKAQHEKKFYLTKTGEGSGIYVCHRASCGFSGGIGDNYVTSTITPKKEFTPKLYLEHMVALRDQDKQYLLDNYQINHTSGMAYAQKEDQLVFKLQTATRDVWGYQTKYQWKRPKGVPKAKLYREKNVPTVHFEHPLGRHTVVLVEDYLSARKLSNILPTVALLGTHLSEEAALEIRKYYTRIVLALDLDAVEKATKLREQWKGLFEAIDIVILQKDVKDTAIHTLEQVFTHYAKDTTDNT